MHGRSATKVEPAAEARTFRLRGKDLTSRGNLVRGVQCVCVPGSVLREWLYLVAILSDASAATLLVAPFLIVEQSFSFFFSNFRGCFFLSLKLTGRRGEASGRAVIDDNRGRDYN